MTGIVLLLDLESDVHRDIFPLYRSLGLPEALRLASLPRNITSPLAMAICAMLAADTSFAIAIVVITGVIGANFGATALDAMG